MVDEGQYGSVFSLIVELKPGDGRFRQRPAQWHSKHMNASGLEHPSELGEGSERFSDVLEYV
jgi:hypothetical protein